LRNPGPRNLIGNVVPGFADAHPGYDSATFFGAAGVG